MAKGAVERLKVIKALAGTSRGQDTESLLLTFKVIVLVKTKLDYAAPVWSPNAKPSSVKRLQAIENAGLCTVTGSHKFAPKSHLHAETKMLPVSDHLAMLSTQSKFQNDIASRLVNGFLPAGTYPETKM